MPGRLDARERRLPSLRRSRGVGLAAAARHLGSERHAGRRTYLLVYALVLVVLWDALDKCAGCPELAFAVT